MHFNRKHDNKNNLRRGRKRIVVWIKIDFSKWNKRKFTVNQKVFGKFVKVNNINFTR